MSGRHLLDGEGAVACTASPRPDGANVTSDPDAVTCEACVRVAPAVTECGCSLEMGVCTLHRNGEHHRHCTTCGIPVFFDEQAVEYDDHRCPPGFLVR